MGTGRGVVFVAAAAPAWSIEGAGGDAGTSSDASANNDVGASSEESRVGP